MDRRTYITDSQCPLFGLSVAQEKVRTPVVKHLGDATELLEIEKENIDYAMAHGGKLPRDEQAVSKKSNFVRLV